MNTKDLIKEFYPKTSRDTRPRPDNKIVYANYSKAILWFDAYFDDIDKEEVKIYRRGVNELQIHLKNGDIIRWMPVAEYVRSMRYTSVVLDYTNISVEFLKTVIVPCGVNCTRNKVEFID